MYIFILLYFLVFAVIAWRRMDWAVMVILFALPSYLIRFRILGLPSTLLEGMILIAFGVWFLKNYRGLFGRLKERFSGKEISGWSRYPFDVEMVLLLIISFIAAGVSGFSTGALGIWKAYFFEPILFFILLLNTIGKEALNEKVEVAIKENNEWLEKILWPLALSALVVSLVAIFQKLTGQLIFNPLWSAAATRRVVSVFGYPNAVGLYLGPLVLLFLGWAKMERKNVSDKKQFLKILAIFVIIILSFLSVIFAKSKGTLLGLSAGLFVFCLLAGKKIRWLAIGAAVILVAGIFSYSPARNLALKEIQLKDLSGEIRKQQWRETWKMLANGRIITGAGLDNYQVAVKPFHQEGIWFNRFNDTDFLKKIRASAEYRKLVWQPVEIYMYPHNIFLNFWSELGLVGLLLFIWIFGKIFYLGRNILLQAETDPYRYLTIALISIFVAMIVHGLVDVPYFKNDLSVMFWILIFIMSLINLKIKRKNYGQ